MRPIQWSFALVTTNCNLVELKTQSTTMSCTIWHKPAYWSKTPASWPQLWIDGMLDSGDGTLESSQIWGHLAGVQDTGSVLFRRQRIGPEDNLPSQGIHFRNRSEPPTRPPPPPPKLPKTAVDRQEHRGNGTPRALGVPRNATRVFLF